MRGRAATEMRGSARETLIRSLFRCLREEVCVWQSSVRRVNKQARGGTAGASATAGRPVHGARRAAGAPSKGWLHGAHGGGGARASAAPPHAEPWGAPLTCPSGPRSGQPPPAQGEGQGGRHERAETMHGRACARLCAQRYVSARLVAYALQLTLFSTACATLLLSKAAAEPPPPHSSAQPAVVSPTAHPAGPTCTVEIFSAPSSSSWMSNLQQ